MDKLKYITLVNNGTGEIHLYRMEVRGFIVANKRAKESKSRLGTSRWAHTKSGNMSNPLQSQMNEDPKDLGFGKIARL